MGIDNRPPIMRLPPEIFEEIASGIDLKHDLVSLALTSKALAALIIPRHTEYRIIRVRHPMPYLWAHLARRADLARNIREIYLCSPHDRSTPDQYPEALIDKSVEGDYGPLNWIESRRVANICKAISCMSKLGVFTWSQGVGEVSRGRTPIEADPAHEDAIFQALLGVSSLKHLGLHNSFSVRCARDGLGSASPLWSISNLHSLSLRGSPWTNPRNSSSLCAMLKRSPGLQYLDIPMEFSRLSECHFPQLLRLRLTLQSGAAAAIDRVHVKFIQAHPTIEELNWRPIGPVYFPPGTLPALKQLSSTHDLAMQLDTVTPRPMQWLDIYAVTRGAISLFQDVTWAKQLKNLSLQRYSGKDVLIALVELFPNLTSLSVPSFDPGFPPLQLADWIKILSCLPNLEVFSGGGLWTAVGMDKNHMHNVIGELAGLCPNLRQLDHCIYDDLRHGYRRIIIVREEGSVRYEVKKAAPRSWFRTEDSIVSQW